MESQGSTWQKWDLHIHTPVSYHWSDGKNWAEQSPAEHDATCQRIVDRMNELDVVAFCIMDYWTFDGYFALREYIDRHPGATPKRIFPGIELRMSAETDFRLNTHALFDDSVLPESLGHFLSHLEMAAPGGKPISRQSFIDTARMYDEGKLKHHGYTVADRADEEKMLLLGMMTIVVSRESVRKAIEKVGQDKCIIIQPYGTSDGLEKLDWKTHSYTDSYLMRWAHCFETRKQSEVELFLGIETQDNKRFIDAFIENLGGHPKPVVSGSDAHEVAKYGVYPSERITWLKAQPTFQGLLQVCHEPSLRCHIGKLPPKLDHVAKNPTKYMRSLSLSKVVGSPLNEYWFDGVTITLNPGLIAIIGNKGSGKSALADILALAANSHCTDMEFLNEQRFRSSGNKAKNFNAALTWADGTTVEITLDRDGDLVEPERCRYLPQHFIEKLCNEIAAGNETNFNKELKKVIFSHVPDDKRLHMGTLDDLLEYTVKARRKAFTQTQQKLATTNENIIRIEEEMSDESIRAHHKSLALKETELEAHEKTRPAEVSKPAAEVEDPAAVAKAAQIQAKQIELARIKTKITEARQERADCVAQDARLKRIFEHVSNIEESYNTCVQENKSEFEDAGLEITAIVAMTIDRNPVIEAETANTTRIRELNELLDGVAKKDGKPAVKGLIALETECNDQITALQDGLNAPEKSYQTYLAEVSAWELRRASIVGTNDKPDTIAYIKERINLATKMLPNQLEALKEDRRCLVRELHAELVGIRDAYEELYKPVQRIASNTDFSTESLQLEFNAYFSTISFESNFLDFINRARRGTFYGEDESKKAVRNLLKEHDFNSADSVVHFVDAVMNALTCIEREGSEREKVTVKSQLRQNKKIGDLYSFIFGLNYLSPQYTLKLGNNDISQLSPGEKGALLLVFYLLLDTEEIPIIIDQPEHNLDNESVVQLLVDCIRQARARRQVMIVTHNPNLAVVCDADQIIYCHIDKTDGHRIKYTSGAIEDNPINKKTVDVLEGTYRAFDNRRKKYHKPIQTFAVQQPDALAATATESAATKVRPAESTSTMPA